MINAIYQQAIKSWNGQYYVSNTPNEVVRYEDSKGMVHQFSGGHDYLKRTEGFPGAGCTDFTVTMLDNIDQITEKLLYNHPTKGWMLYSDLTTDELLDLVCSTTNTPIQQKVVDKLFDNRTIHKE